MPDFSRTPRCQPSHGSSGFGNRRCTPLPRPSSTPDRETGSRAAPGSGAGRAGREPNHPISIAAFPCNRSRTPDEIDRAKTVHGSSHFAFWHLCEARGAWISRSHEKDRSRPCRERRVRLASPAGEGLFVSALGAAQICSWGTLFYGFPLIAEAMRVDLGWSKPTLYGAATLGMILASLSAYNIGAAIDRGHGRLLMAGASVVAGLLLAAWSRIETVWAFYMVLAFLGCMQAATLYEPAFAVIARRFGPARARAGITTLTLWGGFASTVFVPLIQLLIDLHGWRGALMGMAVVNGVICGGLYAFAIDPSKDAPARVHGPDELPPPAGRHAVAAAMRRPAYWGLLVAWLAYAFAFGSLTYHIYPLLLERGLDASGVVAIMTVIGPAQVAGRLAIRAFAPDMPVRTLGSLIVIVFPLAILGFAFAPPDVLVIGAIAAFYGAANGMITIVRGMAVPEMVAPEAYGAVNGSLVGPMNMMQALAPLGAAMLWQAYGGYGAVLAAIFLGALALCAGFWFAAIRSRI
ncbi:MAG: MFS transporter [Rhizobiaceae bacterium]|nr:MFS transporter [Rhizobiaceae bacterium]MCV0405402.1 MFS transporter [Rhizobiaceae bacterium]